MTGFECDTEHYALRYQRITDYVTPHYDWVFMLQVVDGMNDH